MELSYSLPALAALGYSVAAIFSKRALDAGFGVLRLSLIINLLFVPVFALVLLNDSGVTGEMSLLKPVLTGGTFFLGQAFTFAAIRMGDVSVQTPVMGSKAVFVVIIVILLGLESLTGRVIWAAILSMLAVGLLGISGTGPTAVLRTITLALLSSFFFACSDTMVAFWGRDYGGTRFLFLMIASNAMFSFVLVPLFHEPIRLVPRAAWRWGIIAGLLMASQALIMNYSLTTYQNVASANVIYSTRGLWSVLLGIIPLACLHNSSIPKDLKVRSARLVGAALMCLAIYILFSS